jgi:hypothetical protein
MWKNFVKNILKRKDIELCRFSANDRDYATRMGWEKFTYKDLQIAHALAYEGHIRIEEAKFLLSLVSQTNADDPIIEVGTLFGYSTTVLATGKAASQKLITVDNYIWNSLGISAEAHRLSTLAALADARENHNVVVVSQDKNDFYKEYQGPPPGLFFCDAHHDYEPTLRDLTWAREIGAKIICGHDYNEKLFPGVVEAVKELGGAKQVVGSLFVL